MKVLLTSWVAVVAVLGLVMGAHAAALTEEYFLVRRDARECAFPQCGGFFLNPVNVEHVECPAGSKASRKGECYVAEIRGFTVGPNIGLVRGFFVPYGDNLQAFEAVEAFEGTVHQAANTRDIFLSVNDVGIQCLTEPCLRYHASRLNSKSYARNILRFGDVDFSKIPKKEESTRQEMRFKDVIISAVSYTISGPAGDALGLRISNVFVKVGAPAKSCTRPHDCGKNEFCSKSECGAPTGVCQPRPSSCTRKSDPVCACDGLREYENDCIRQLHGVQASTHGKCPVVEA